MSGCKAVNAYAYNQNYLDLYILCRLHRQALYYIRKYEINNLDYYFVKIKEKREQALQQNYEYSKDTKLHTGYGRDNGFGRYNVRISENADKIFIYKCQISNNQRIKMQQLRLLFIYLSEKWQIFHIYLWILTKKWCII